MPFLDDVIKLARDWDASRPRSQQALPGWSEVGGCRAYLGYRLDGAWPSDEPDSWGAIRGTAIHAFLEQILSGVPGFRTELTTSYRGIPGHADLIVVDESGVADWKTTKLANARLWLEKPRSLWEKRVQVHGYAAGLIEAGELPETAMVRLVIIPVDGTFADWWCWEEPFDRAIADWGADRLQEVRDRMAAGEPLQKDKPLYFCRDWCRFYSLCRGADDPQEAEPITDPELSAAVESYGEAHIRFAAAKKEKDRLAPMIRGLHGAAGDWSVSMTKGGDEGEDWDEAAIQAHYAAIGEPVPMTTKAGAAPRLNVRRIKREAA